MGLIISYGCGVVSLSPFKTFTEFIADGQEKTKGDKMKKVKLEGIVSITDYHSGACLKITDDRFTRHKVNKLSLNRLLRYFGNEKKLKIIVKEVK